MASVRRVVDVAVVDEIQLMADRSRGHAFTRALLGLPARTLHVCGDPASLPLLEQLCQAAGGCGRVMAHVCGGSCLWQEGGKVLLRYWGVRRCVGGR